MIHPSSHPVTHIHSHSHRVADSVNSTASVTPPLAPAAAPAASSPRVSVQATTSASVPSVHSAPSITPTALPTGSSPPSSPLFSLCSSSSPSSSVSSSSPSKGVTSCQQNQHRDTINTHACDTQVTHSHPHTVSSTHRHPQSQSVTPSHASLTHTQCSTSTAPVIRKGTFRIYLYHTKSRNRTGALYPVILVLRHLLPHSFQSFMPSLLYRYDPNHPHVHLVTAPALNFYTFAPLNDPTCSLTLKQQAQQLIDSTHESYVFQEFTPELHTSLDSLTAIAVDAHIASVNHVVGVTPSLASRPATVPQTSFSSPYGDLLAAMPYYQSHCY